jgi:predicted site-specific integrase-resolvase|tara:strand:- start:238 stop:546 length:309 start_codon:yes stop_codon:yes gene_type:complete
MSKDKEPKDFLSDLPMGERLEMERMIMDEAFENSYRIVTKKMTFEELAEKSKAFSESSHTILVYDPTEDPDTEVLEDLIEHFEDREEYEKCAELKRILDVQL